MRLRIDWFAVAAGLIAGLIFLMLEMLLVPLFLGGSPWGPPRMIAAMVLGTEVLPPPATFDAGVFIAAMVVHFMLSILFGIIAALLVYGRRKAAAALIGGGYGVLLYLFNFYIMTAVFPWFANARNWVAIFSHIVFGAVAALVYLGLGRKRVIEERVYQEEELQEQV